MEDALAPQKYVGWLSAHAGFNPRSQRHSDVLSGFIMEDLRALAPHISRDLSQGATRLQRNGDVKTLTTFRNIDFVLADVMVDGPLHQVRLSIEHKSIMAAHGKARKNRLGDIYAYVNHVHNHHAQAIAAVTMVINTSPVYVNPDSFAQKIERTQLSPDAWARLIRDTVRIFSDIPLRERPDEPNDQPEALAIMLVDYDGSGPARLIADPPAPQPGDPCHITEFYRRIVALYDARF